MLLHPRSRFCFLGCALSIDLLPSWALSVLERVHTVLFLAVVASADIVDAF